MRLQNRRVLGTSVLGLGAALVLAGCGAGQITQTDTMVPAVNGALASAGKLSVNNASLVNNDTCEQALAPGSSVALALTIANAGGADDELVSVHSDNAANATIHGQKTVVARSTLVVGPANRTESGAGSPSTAAPTGLGHANVELQGLKAVIWPGMTMPVTLTFRDAPTKELNCAEAKGGAGH